MSPNVDPAKTILSRLIAYIKDAGLRPGDRLPSIRECAAQWGVNSSVVRDGFQHAQALGVITLHPRAGAFVGEFAYQRLADLFSSLVEIAFHQTDPLLINLYDARLTIELETTRLVALHHTSEGLLALRESLKPVQEMCDSATFVAVDETFHLTIARLSLNPIYETMLAPILAFLRPSRLALVRTASELALTAAQHDHLFQAIAAGDIDATRQYITAHLSRRKQQLLETLPGAHVAQASL
jgi:DNA-binding FadR family transcriptional regulator